MMPTDEELAELAIARREAKLAGAMVHLFGWDEMVMDADMRLCTEPDGGQGAVLHANCAETTVGKWCEDCGECEGEEGEG